MLCRIARIRFEAVFRMPLKDVSKGNSNKVYSQDDGLVTYEVYKDGGIFVLEVSLLDLFGVDSGLWSEKDFPERENLIRDALERIERELNCTIKVIEIERKVD
jgi:hypothetical protein